MVNFKCEFDDANHSCNTQSSKHYEKVFKLSLVENLVYE